MLHFIFAIHMIAVFRVTNFVSQIIVS